MRKRAPAVLAVAAILASSATIAAEPSPEFFVEAGQCRFGVERDGVFYQTDKHTDNYMHPACASLGFQNKWKGSDWFGWRVAAIKTGSISARGNVATVDEAQHQSGQCDPNTGMFCLYRFDGRGDLRGLSLGLTGDVRLPAGFKLTGETALLFSKSSFSVTITPISDPNAPERRGELHGSWTDTPTMMLGASLRWGPAYVFARKYSAAEHRSLNLTDYSFWNFGVGAAAAF